MNRNFRVTHIIGGGEFGGAEEHVLLLLKQLEQQQINTHVICFYDSLFAERLRENDIAVDVLTYGRFDARVYSGLVKLLKNRNPHIIHTHGVKANFFGRLAARKLGTAPVVTTVHSLLKYDYNSKFAQFVVRVMEGRTRKLTDHYIAISNKIKTQLLDDKVTEDKIDVIHHGIDTSNFTPSEDEKAVEIARHWGKVNEHQFLIGSIGRLKDVKGFDYFIKACEILHEKDPGKFRFVIVGSGVELENLQEQVASSKLESVFTFAGFRSDIASCLRAFDCYVSSSISEGLGLAVMEALATGTPVVATGVGGVVDFAKDGVNSLLIEAKDADKIADSVYKIATDKKLAKRLSERAVSDMELGFSVNRMANETAQLYKRLLDKQKQS